MSDPKLDRWVDQVLDGGASEEERVLLEQRIAIDPSARERATEHAALFETLRRVPRPDPPDDLRESILSAIASRQAPDAAPTWSDALRSLLSRRPALGVSYAVAAGAVIGVVTTLVLTGALAPGPDARLPHYGTMVAPSSTNASFATGRLAVPGAWIEAETVPTGDLVRLSVHGRAATPTEITVVFDPRELRVTSIVPRAGDVLPMNLAPGRLTLAGKGDVRLEMNWLPLVSTAAPLEISIGGGETRVPLFLAVRARGHDEPPGH